MSIFDTRLKYATTKVWDSTDSNFKFPEEGDSQLKLPDISGRPNVGIAFSGGGTRSASATLGQLRGLDKLDLLRSVRYISSVSGGAWTAVPFTYLPGSWTDEQFLGQPTEPRKISIEGLKRTDRNSFAHRIANSIIIDDFFEHAGKLAGDETFSRAIGNIFLDGMGIDSLGRFFTFDDRTRDVILRRNKKMRAGDFYAARGGRPFLIAGSTILRPDNVTPKPRRIHFETTPLYAGVRVRHRKAGSQDRDIGGGYLEPFAFDSDAPENAPNNRQEVTVRLGAKRHRYTLSDVMGSSGAAPAEVLDEIGLDFLGFPEFKHWPADRPHRTSAKEYEFGDGGILENLGIMPLLMRRVQKIIVFVNTRDRLKGPGPGEINDSIRPLFGQTPDFTENHVFPKSKYLRLVDGLLTAKSNGKTVMFRDTYPVRRARHYGIESGWEVTVLWVYNERVASWESKLREEVADLVSSGSLGSFPHYKTFFQNPPKLIDLSATQVQMLAHLSCWNVTSNAADLEQMLT